MSGGLDIWPSQNSLACHVHEMQPTGPSLPLNVTCTSMSGVNAFCLTKEPSLVCWYLSAMSWMLKMAVYNYS